MLTARMDAGQNKNYERFYVVAGFDDETLCHAKRIFKEYHDKGVIINENFADNEWVIINQLKRTTLRFYSNELVFRNQAKKWLGCSYRDFIDRVKAYTAFHMGSIELSGIREIMRKLMSLAEKSCDDLPVDTHVIEFLKLLPGDKIKD